MMIYKMNILNEHKFASVSDVPNPDRYAGWFCSPAERAGRLIQHRDKISNMKSIYLTLVFLFVAGIHCFAGTTVNSNYLDKTVIATNATINARDNSVADEVNPSLYAVTRAVPSIVAFAVSVLMLLQP